MTHVLAVQLLSVRRHPVRRHLAAGLLALLAFASAAALLLGARPTSAPADPAAAVTKQRSLDAYAKLPLTFIPNAGQTDARVRFHAHGPGHSFYFTPRAAVLAFTKRAEGKERGVALHLRFAGANPAPRIEGVQTSTGTVNYFVGRDPAKWQTGLRTYHAVVYRDLWPGTAMVFRGLNGKLKYEFRLAPGADPSKIRLAYAGAESLSVGAAGRLLIATHLGVLTDARPLAYQRIDGRKVPVESRYALNGGVGTKRSYGFTLGAHDPRYPLVIDPGLAYSTYLGGTGLDFGSGVVVDNEGHAYVTGRADAPDFPTTPGSFQRTDPAPDQDGFVAKLNPSGSALIYSTYLGGNGIDTGFDVKVDERGNAYVAGRTESTNFPTTPGSFQAADPDPDAGPSGRDGFVTKLNRSGSALRYSTYLGGSDRDQGNGLAIDKNGNAYVDGSTRSVNFPTTPGAFQAADPDPAPGGAGTDAFVTKLNSSGSALVYSTYVGGTGVDFGDFGSVEVDEDGSAYLSGGTEALNFPTTPGSFQDEDPDAVPGGQGRDAFVTKLEPSGSALVYSTYLGGAGPDAHFDAQLALDENANAYVTGDTGSDNFPTTPGAFQDTDPSPGACDVLADDEGPGCDAFVTKLNRSGTALAYSTYLGATGAEAGVSVAVDEDGSASVAGVTESTDFPTTPDAFAPTDPDPTPNGADIFVTKLNRSGTGLVYSSYLGGNAQLDAPTQITVDGDGDPYVTGGTESTNFPTTPGAFQDEDPDPLFPGRDGFLTKFDLE